MEIDLTGAQHVITDLAELGIHISRVTQQLEDEGVKAFSDAFDTLLTAIKARLG